MTRRNNVSKKAAAAAAAALALASSAAAVEYQFASAGGDPAAATAGHYGMPTKAWKQWQPKPSYAPSQLPDQFMGQSRLGPGSDSQTGWNRCAANKWNQASNCQTIYINSIDDWCLFGPPTPGAVGLMERKTVGYCTQPKWGTRLIPDGTVTGAHFVQTKSYVQITGTGDFSSIGVPVDDQGGELDSGGADDLENPIGGVVYSTALSKSGKPQMAPHWSSFLSANQFCFRACYGDDAHAHCQNVFDTAGCEWNQPANYSPGVFESCDGDEADFAGVYTNGGKATTLSQGATDLPPPHPAPASSNCQAQPTVSNGIIRAVKVGDTANSLLAGASTQGAKVKTGMATFASALATNTAVAAASSDSGSGSSTTGKSAASPAHGGNAVGLAIVAAAGSVAAWSLFA